MTSQVIMFFGAAAIFLHSLCAINEMHRKTYFIRRVAYLFLCIGAFALMVQPLCGGFTDRWPTTAVVGGAGLYFVGHQRAVIFAAVVSAFIWRHSRHHHRIGMRT
jgi:small neutral amino acid transporter SnatA (MarC family)